ncbi:YIP1 family protein [Paenibacillus lignilyticus]|uniref:YIP1 family protein n=1 Tax=Paenibacillus lignilyticus TaxID=1172615 RepID=A0ABS5C899_9BACL|nr:YIP1 family protein [Paenibacillus lignilyticus]
MKARKRSMYALLLGFCLFLLVLPGVANAALPYWTLSSDANGRWIWTPDAFVPVQAWTGFKDPEDLFVAEDDAIFVADTGNDRIVELSPTGEMVRTFPDVSKSEDGKITNPKEQLRKPEGVFISKEGEVYIADTGSRRIAVFDRNAKFLREYVEPKDPAMSKSYSFIPAKLVLDRRGYIYVANKGGYQGLLQLTPTGQFAGFFGSNKVPMDWIQTLKRKFYTDEQLKSEQLLLPGAITDMTVDANGFIYTVNRDMRDGQLRQLNSGGVDLLGNLNFAPWLVPPNKLSFTSVAVDKNGIITVLEAARGRIFQYDSKGRLIFRFGNASTGEARLGLFKRATAVGLQSNGNILVADGELGDIQVFKRTEFGSKVHEAVTLFADGQYQKGEPLWREILLRNANYERSYQGIAKADFYDNDYEGAMNYFSKAFDQKGYSEAFWQVRMNWLMKYFALCMSILVGLLIVVFGGKRLAVKLGWYTPKRKQATRVDRTTLHGWRESARQAFRILRHPVNGMTEIGEGMRIKLTVAFIIVILSFGFTLIGKAIANFIFVETRFQELNLWSEAQNFILPWFIWVIGSYLTGSVLKGQGTFRNVFIVNSFALMPIVVINLPAQLISRVLTLQESVIYNLIVNGMYAWMFILLFIGTMCVHNYNLKEAIKMATVSLFTMACLWIFGFVLFGLVYQSVDFFLTLGEELMERVA